jgi:hypothetical protein
MDQAEDIEKNALKHRRVSDKKINGITQVKVAAGSSNVSTR